MPLLRSSRSVLLLTLITMNAIACARPRQAEPLSAAEFTPAPATIAEEPFSSIDQPGPIDPNRHVQIAPTAEQEPSAPTGIQPPVEPAPESPAEPTSATTAPTTQTIATPPPTVAVGQYLILGAVVAEVNGIPIYAHQIVADLEPLLSARAKELDVDQFQTVATSEIRDRIIARIQEELRYAAAQRSLDDRERTMADNLTSKWRQDQIILAGGSLELAKRQAAEQGQDFEDMVRERHKLEMNRIYLAKRVFPRVHVTPTEMRQFYERNREQMFTQHGQARFRIIGITARKVGSRERALDLAQDVRQRAIDGADFQTLAAEHNSDTRFTSFNQNLSPVARGSFVEPKIEEAVWSLQPNQVSDVIDAGDAFYVVQLVSKEEGRVQPFESRETQEQIERVLRSQQIAQQEAKLIAELGQDAIIRGDPYRQPDMMRPAVEIAMQRYPLWRAAE